MTSDEIRTAISVSPTIRALVPDTTAIAAALSVGRKETYSRITSARGIADLFPGGPIGAEVVIMKIEGAASTMKASADAQQKVLGSLITRQLGFLAGEGLDFGSVALRGMLDQFVGLGILTADDVVGLKSIGERAAPVSEFAVRAAIFADDGTLRV